MSKDKGRKEVKKPKQSKMKIFQTIRRSQGRKNALDLLLEASSRIHRTEIQILYAKVARIKRAYIMKHGKQPAGITA